MKTRATAENNPTAQVGQACCSGGISCFSSTGFGVRVSKVQPSLSSELPARSGAIS